MTVHAALLVQRVQALAAGSPHIVTVRLIVCDWVWDWNALGCELTNPKSKTIHPTPKQGDFNFQPSGPQ